MSDPEMPLPLSEKEIFFAAMEQPTPRERAAFLNGACGTNPSQRARVEALLTDHFEEDAFMMEPAVDASPRMSPELPPEAPSQMLGRYKLLEKIGEGGFGEVWMAEQREPVKLRVALKIIKLGMDSRQIVARFDAERQALAMMDYPNIARILDADLTDNGRPYFVMELVRGIRITDYCDQNQLPTRERLDLFIKVCQAIQHAHQKGVIHRDIKPSNVLVTLHDGVPVPKVIDFGIAKATQGELTEKTLFTQFQQFIGTPAYISPEQAEMSGLDVDTRSDIYSLGVLLYELLVGQTPFDAKEMMNGGLDALRQIIREREPQRPSTRLNTLASDALTTAAKRRQTEVDKLVLQLRGDLDWIVMKCLEKDRTRRYDAAASLASDIRRHLANEPVLARPPSTAYRIQKAWQRHKLAFTASAAVALALLAGTGVSTWQAVEATRAREAEVKQRIAAQKAQAEATAQKTVAEAQLTRAEWALYAGKLLLAQTDFEAGNGGLALHYLDECQVDLRGWEHRYLRTRIDARHTLSGHGDAVTSAAFSAGGKRVVTGSQDRTAKVWDAATGKELVTLTGHDGMVSSVAFSPDGTRIVTGAGHWSSPDEIPGEAKVWDAGTGRELLDLKGHAACVWSVAFSSDGTRIVTSSDDGTAKVWDAATGERLRSLDAHCKGLRSAGFSSDGKRIVAGSVDGTVKIWDTETGEEVFDLKARDGGVSCVAFSPNGRNIVIGNFDKTVKIRDAGTGGEILSIDGFAARVSSVAFSPDGRRLVTGSWDQTARVWDVGTGVEIFALKGHGDYLRSVAFSPDGKRILTASNDRTAKVWDAVKGQEVPVLSGHLDTIWSMAVSPDGTRIVTASSDQTVRLWDTASGEEVLSFEHAVAKVGNVLIVRGVAFSPDGKRIVAGSTDGTAKVLDAATGEVIRTLPHAYAVLAVAYSPDGKRILTGTGDPAGTGPGKVVLWDAETGTEPLLTKDSSSVVRSVVFSPDGGSLAAGLADGTAKLWDAATGRELRTLAGHKLIVNGVVFYPDGKRIVTASADGTAKVWDVATGRELLKLLGHTGHLSGVAISPDGKRIVTGSGDQSAKVWEAETGHEMLALKGHSQMVWCVAFSPDGNRILTGTAGGFAVVKVWYAAPAVGESTGGTR